MSIDSRDLNAQQLSKELDVSVVVTRLGNFDLRFSDWKEFLFQVLVSLSRLQRILMSSTISLHKTCSFVSRFFINSRTTVMPEDPKKLRISGDALRTLLSHLDAPPAFASCLARYYQLPERGYRLNTTAGNSRSFDLWYMIPVRVQVECTDTIQKHANTNAGSNQMDPFNYLHLESEKLDIRGSQIAVLFHYDCTKRAGTTVSIRLQDGRWSRVVEEPQTRISEMLDQVGVTECEADPFFVHVIFITSALKWWRNALDSFNNQLIAHVRYLLFNILWTSIDVA
jgi:hypothetical protein